MFKQLQELQRRQQLQELGDNRNHNFVNQLSSLKHASVGQISGTVNGGTPILDSSQMSIFGNMEVMPSGLLLPQSQNPDALSAIGLSLPQFGISPYGNQGPNDGKNFHQYSHLQGPSNLSIDQRTKNHSNLGTANMQLPPFIGNSFMNPQLNFPSDRIHMPDGQASFEGYNRESLSENYSPQGIPMQGNSSLLESELGHQDANWDGFSSGKPSSPGHSERAASLDPLEQKILYGTDDDIWEPSLNGNLSTGLFQSTGEHTSQMDSLPSMQSGSWSALMQSAVAETSSADTGMQEQWSGPSFKNPESFNGNQLPSFIESQQLQSNWVDRNLQSAALPSTGPEHLFHNFPNFQESGHQYGPTHSTPELFPGNTGQLMDYSSQQKLPTSGKQRIQTPLSTTMSPDSGFRLQPTDPQAPQAYAFSPKIGNSSKTYLSGNIVSDTEKKHPSLPVPRPMATEFLAYSAAAARPNSELKIIQSGSQEFPHLENNLTTHPPSNSDGLQLVVQPTPWPDITSQQGSDAKPYKFPHLFGFSNPASGSLEETKPPNLKASLCEQELVSYIRKPEGSDQQFKQGNSLPENSSEINNSASLGSTNMQQFKENHYLEAGAIDSDSLRIDMHQQPSSHVEGGDGEAPSIPPGDVGAFGNSLSKNYSLQHQLLPSRNIETDGHKTGVEDIAKDGPHVVPQLGAFWSSGIKGLNCSQAPGVDELARASGSALHQKQEDTICQNNIPVHSIDGIEASNVAYPSQISLHMAPSWINQHSLKARSTLPICESSLVKAGQQFSGLQQNSLTMQMNLADSDLGIGIYPPAAVTAISPSMVATDVASQKLAASIPKKRKLTEFSMVPWHKEMNHQPSMPHDISVTELAWAEALNRRAMEVSAEADIFLEYLPKRRLICTTQLTQNVLGPMPAVTLWSSAGSHSDIIPYSAARLILGYACNMTGQCLNGTNDTSPDRPKASKRRKAGEFAKVAEGFGSRAEKLKADLERFSRSYYTSMRCEGQELEKFSIINRFAKIHIKALTSAVDPATSSASAQALPRISIQRYVVAVPMPSILPEGVDCLSL